MGRTRIHCHPDNLDLVKKIVGDRQVKEKDVTSGFLHYIDPDPFYGIKFIKDVNLPKERPTGKYLVEGNRFYDWWDGQGDPPSWALYFGLVKPIMEPLFYEVADYSVYMRYDSFPVIYDKRILMTSVTT